MTLLKTLLLFLSSTFLLQAQSFYSLTDVDSYDQIVVNSVPNTSQYNKDIKTLMTAMSNELGIVTQGHPSRVLVFVIKRFSVGESIGIKVACIVNGEIIEKYMDDKPYPSFLVLDYENEEISKPLHVVFAKNNEEIIIITAYRPDKKKWSNDYKQRIEK